MALMIYQRTAEEVAQCDDDLVHEYLNRREFRLATMNNRVREAMLAAMVAENNITGGWFYTDKAGDEYGPFETHGDARAAYAVQICKAKGVL